MFHFILSNITYVVIPKLDVWLYLLNQIILNENG